MTKEPTFPEIKKETVEAIQRIETYIEEGNKSREDLKNIVLKMHTKIYGDEEKNPPIAGMEDRLKHLERVEADRIRAKDTLLKMTVGSLTIAIGGVVVWVFGVLRDAFIRNH